MMHTMKPWKNNKKESEMQKLKEKQEQDMKLMREEMNQNFSQIISIIQRNPMLNNIKPEVLSSKVIEKRHFP
jgi:Txe/YoeB family toxin of Txe-Axe toxin-antitoxin module